MTATEWAQWKQTFFQSLGINNPSPGAETFLDSWFGMEGADMGFNNPLNITKSYNGLSSGQGGTQGNILKFPNVTTSAQETAAFLQHGYGDIIAALQSGTPSSWNLAGSLLAWSSGGYSHIVSGTGTVTDNPTGTNLGASKTGVVDTGSGSSHGIFSGFFAPFEAAIATSGILLAATLLIVAGGLWIVVAGINSPTGQSVKKTVGQVAEVIPK